MKEVFISQTARLNFDTAKAGKMFVKGYQRPTMDIK